MRQFGEASHIRQICLVERMFRLLEELTVMKVVERRQALFGRGRHHSNWPHETAPCVPVRGYGHMWRLSLLAGGAFVPFKRQDADYEKCDQVGRENEL